MTVDVRLFAALRAAAGVPRVTVEAGTVGEVRRALEERYGEPFASRLARSTAIVDEQAVDDDAALTDGAEVAFLPPFSGG